jgi:hypothetical protein
MHRHLPRPESVMLSTTQEPSPSSQRCSRAHNNIVLPEPAMLCTRRHADPTTPSNHVVPGSVAPSSSLSPRRPRAHDIVEPTLSLSPQRRRPPQTSKAIILYIFLCHFGPTNPDFDMLHYHIALICTLLLFCCIALV